MCVEMGDKDRRLAPAGIDFGVERHRKPASGFQLSAQRSAIGVGDGAGDRRRHLRQHLGGGAAPDRRDAHLVKMLMRADMELADRAGGLGVRGCGWARDAIDEHDLAAAIQLGEIGHRSLPDIDEIGRQAAFRRIEREGMSDALEGAPIGLDTRSPGQADIGIVQDELGSVAIAIETFFQIVEAFELLGRAGELHALGEFDAMGHQLLAADGRAQRGCHVVHAGVPSTRRVAASIAAM